MAIIKRSLKCTKENLIGWKVMYLGYLLVKNLTGLLSFLKKNSHDKEIYDFTHQKNKRMKQTTVILVQGSTEWIKIIYWACNWHKTEIDWEFFQWSVKNLLYLFFVHVSIFLAVNYNHPKLYRTELHYFFPLIKTVW